MTEVDTTAADRQDPGRGSLSRVRCGGCEPLGRCRLGIETERFDPETGSLHVELECPPEYEGGPQVAHGGWTASALDEVLGVLPIVHGGRAVTGKLEVVYLRPVPISRRLVGRARLDRREGRRWYVSGDLRLASTGAELARATGIWVERAPGHFERHQAWLAGQDERVTGSTSPSGPSRAAGAG